MLTKPTNPNQETGTCYGRLRTFSLSTFVALSLTMAAAQQEVKAETPPASIETITALQGPSTALENGVKGFNLPGFFCRDIDKTTRDRQLQELKDINARWQTQIQEMVRWASSQRGRPIAAHYEREIRQVILLNAKLKRIARDIDIKRDALWAVPVKDCANTATDVSVAVPETPSEPVDPLADIAFWQPHYYDVTAPGAPGRLCKEIDKLDYLVSVAAARANAGFNMNQADGVISDIEGHLRNTQNAATRAALEAMLVTAKANLQKRIAELDEFDKLYEAAQKLEVEDCFSMDTEAAMADPLDQSQFSDMDVEVHVPDLKDVTFIELPAFVCDEDERGRLMASATVQSSKALINVYEWQKRRDSIAEALRQGKGNTSLLRQARYEADMEIGKRDIIHSQTQDIFETARELPIVDCSGDNDNRTSMGPVTVPETDQRDAMLTAINDMLFGPSPYRSNGEVALPFPSEQDDGLIYEAEHGVKDRQKDVRRHEHWQERKDPSRAAGEHHHSASGHKDASAKKSKASTNPNKAGTVHDGKSKTAETAYNKEVLGYPSETKPAGPLDFPLKTGTKPVAQPKEELPKDPASPQLEITHDNLDYRTGSDEASAPGKVYPPLKTTAPALKAPGNYQKQPVGQTGTDHAELKEPGQWVQVRPPILTIPVEAAGAERRNPELY